MEALCPLTYSAQDLGLCVQTVIPLQNKAVVLSNLYIWVAGKKRTGRGGGCVRKVKYQLTS